MTSKFINNKDSHVGGPIIERVESAFLTRGYDAKDALLIDNASTKAFKDAQRSSSKKNIPDIFLYRQWMKMTLLRKALTAFPIAYRRFFWFVMGFRLKSAHLKELALKVFLFKQ